MPPGPISIDPVWLMEMSRKSGDRPRGQVKEMVIEDGRGVMDGQDRKRHIYFSADPYTVNYRLRAYAKACL